MAENPFTQTEPDGTKMLVNGLGCSTRRIWQRTQELDGKICRIYKRQNRMLWWTFSI